MMMPGASSPRKPSMPDADDLREGRALLGAIAALHREDIDDDHDPDAHQHAGNHAAEEQLADRHLGQRAIDHHRDRRRDHRADGRGRGDDGAGEGLVEAAVLHRLDLDDAQAHRFGKGRTGHAGKQHRGKNADVREAAAHVADHRAGEAENPVGHAAGVHQVSGEDEERDRQQRETTTPRNTSAAPSPRSCAAHRAPEKIRPRSGPWPPRSEIRPGSKARGR